MADIAICIENLGKKYTIGHQSDSSRYVALRDVVADTLRSFGRRKKYTVEDFWALRDVSFDVGRGEVVGIIGKNGAGKSTLLKLLSRITEPSSGKFRIKGRVASLLEVGTGFHPELTGRENIFLNGAILGMPRAEIKRRFDEIVEFAEVEKFLDTPVKRYSSGMYVRLAFSVAAHLEPEILIVDEVLAVGDIAFQKKCLEQMGRAAQDGKTVLAVSHNMQVVANQCSKAVWLDRGQVQMIGTANAVIGAYEIQARASSDRIGARIIRDRKGCAIQWAEILAEEGSPCVCFQRGETMTLIIGLDRNLPPAAYFEWILHSERGGIASSGGTYLPSEGFSLPTASGDLRVRIGPLPFTDGRYSLTVKVGILPGMATDEWHSVEDISMTGEIPEGVAIPFDNRRGSVYVPAYYDDPAVDWPCAAPAYDNKTVMSE